jgi:hypothetical protein
VTVAGKKLTYDDFKASDSPCNIPHEFQSSGVKITTTCPGVLQLTAEHLVMTSEGPTLHSLSHEVVLNR